MHRINRLNELVKEWLALELNETCSRADSLNRIQIRRSLNPDELTFSSSRNNRVWLTIGLYQGTVGFTTGYTEKDEFITISQAIWALEYAVENY